ncbi:MAG: hypothetical protein AAGG50_07380 [Bacteroidota bacterium]
MNFVFGLATLDGDKTIHVCLILILLFVIWLSISHVIHIKNMEEIYNKVGTKVKYVGVDKHGGASSIYQEAIRYVERAESEIIVVNSYLRESGPNSIEYRNSRSELSNLNKYYKSIFKKLESNKEVEYTRIIQTDKNGKFPGRVHQKEAMDHIEKMILNNKLNDQISLYQTLPTRATSFVLIDKKYLILQINRYEEDGIIRLDGGFHVEDASGEVLNHFVKFYKRIMKSKKPVSMDDITKWRSINSERIRDTPSVSGD